MASSGAHAVPGNLRAQLAVPPATAANRLNDSIEHGTALLNTRYEGPESFNTLRANRSQWDTRNRELLRRIFKTDAAARAYERAGLISTEAVATPKIDYERLRDSVADKLGFLRSVSDQLEQGGGDAAERAPASSSGERPLMFVIHMGDAPLARAVAQFLESVRASVKIVTDRPGDGEIDYDQTEAFPEARFAVVLVAGDQVGGSAKAGSPARAVSPEALVRLGFVAGRLGAANVCALHQAGVQIPGARLRLRGIEFDEAGGWKLQLANRITAAGIEISDGRY